MADNSTPRPIHLGVNIDHVATVRQARGTVYPSPLEAALAAERGGATGITAHLREDRRHIQDHDIDALASGIGTKLNLEMAVAAEVVDIALRVKPADACLVPERREELTTEGGLAVSSQLDNVRDVTSRLADAGVQVSLFIDPERREIDAAVAAGAPVIELHTGAYADAPDAAAAASELARLREAAAYAESAGLVVNAGHGLTRTNVGDIAAIAQIHELNIGHALVADALMMGMEEAARAMLAACVAGRERS